MPAKNHKIECCLCVLETTIVCVNQLIKSVTKFRVDYGSREIKDGISNETCFYLHIAWRPHCGCNPEAITNCIMNEGFFFLPAIKWT